MNSLGKLVASGALISIAFAQQPLKPAESPEPGGLEGTVVNEATGQPLSRVSLQLYRASGGARSYVTSTDSTGKFVMKGIEPGQYRLGAWRNGFIRIEYGAKRSRRQGMVLDLVAGQVKKGIDLKLTPHAVVTGRVVDSEGEPLVGVQVQAMRRSFDHGRPGWTSDANASTNDLGEYRIHGLAEGRYIIGVQPFPVSGEGEIDASGRGNRETFMISYHPGVAAVEEASQLNVAAGARIQGVDIAMRRGRAFSVRGKFLGVPRGDIAVTGSLNSRAHREAGFAGRAFFLRNRPDGSFEVAGVFPGSYTLFAIYHHPDNAMKGRTDVEVQDADISGVTVRLESGFDVKGSVRVEGAEQFTLGPMRVSLDPVAGGHYYGGASGAVKADGAFPLRQLQSGKYKIRVERLPEDFYFKSAKFGSAELTDGEIEITSAGELEVVVSPHGARVEGLVKNTDGIAAPSSTVLLLPDKAGHRTRQATTDPAGRFSIRGLAPGTWHAIALEDYEYGMESVPEFRTEHSSGIKRIELAERSVVNIDLREASSSTSR